MLVGRRRRKKRDENVGLQDELFMSPLERGERYRAREEKALAQRVKQKIKKPYFPGIDRREMGLLWETSTGEQREAYEYWLDICKPYEDIRLEAATFAWGMVVMWTLDRKITGTVWTVRRGRLDLDAPVGYSRRLP
jgi:hypothetical protein